MAVRLERGELSLLVSLLALEITKGGNSSYRQRLTAIRDKLLVRLAEKEPEGDGDLPDFREYARKRYPAELDEDMVTMVDSFRCEDRGPGRGAASLEKESKGGDAYWRMKFQRHVGKTDYYKNLRKEKKGEKENL